MNLARHRSTFNLISHIALRRLCFGLYFLCCCKAVSSLTMTDRYTIHSQLEHLQSKYIGTGHADTTKWEWLVNQHRDSYCSYMGHFDLLNYFAIAENESKARVRFNLMEKMLQPCGPPADKPDDV
ncbi:splicing factor 3B subunit 5 isoform X1 [Erpetoichthys calabaricus]|nr:splicing factor 3B subunit 5 isoform X1 [Erpetoichthys calabaricus]